MLKTIDEIRDTIISKYDPDRIILFGKNYIEPVGFHFVLPNLQLKNIHSRLSIHGS